MSIPASTCFRSGATCCIWRARSRPPDKEARPDDAAVALAQRHLPGGAVHVGPEHLQRPSPALLGRMGLRPGRCLAGAEALPRLDDDPGLLQPRRRAAVAP